MPQPGHRRTAGGGQSALARLTNGLVSDAAVVDPALLDKLRDSKLSESSLAKLVLSIADQIIAAPKFSGQSLDVNIVRALLYLQRSDPRIDQRVRQYLYGHKLNDLSQEAVAALDPNNPNIKKTIEDATISIEAQNPGFSGKMGKGRLDLLKPLECLNTDCAPPIRSLSAETRLGSRGAGGAGGRTRFWPSTLGLHR